MSVSDPVNAEDATRRLEGQLAPPRRDGDDPMIGREVIGQYRIEKKLGAGGMGTVYLAQQTSVSRPAVIKVLRSQGDGASDSTARFAVEAKAASNLNHPNIVTIYNYGQMEDGTLFLAMEYIAGETLAQRLERCGSIPVDRAVHVAAQIARAIGEAHAHGVVHRDLKPANVMLVERAGEPDFVKVLDFGIAKVDDAGVTSTGYVVGTPRYMSPEQLLGKKLDGRSDIYSAGIVLYEMLAGATPFQSETPMGWLHQHVEVAPRPPSELAKRNKIPPAVDEVVLRAIAKAPGDRPSSMEMLALDLVAALNAPTEPPPPPWWRRAASRAGQILVAAIVAIASGLRKVTRTISAGVRRVARAVAASTLRGLRAIGTGAWRVVRAIGSAIRRSARAVGSGARRLVRAIASAPGRCSRALRARRSAAAARKAAKAAPLTTAPRPASTPARRVPRSLASMPIGRRLLVALLVVVASAALLAAVSPQVRSDFGLARGGDDKARDDKARVGKTKRPDAPAPTPTRERPRDEKPRDKTR